MTTQAIIIESGNCFDQRIRIVRTGREPPSWRDFQMVCPCVYSGEYVRGIDHGSYHSAQASDVV